MKYIETQVINRPDGRITVASNLNMNLIAQFTEYSFLNKLTDLMAEKAVKEIWKKHGATIIKKVDKKTIGNLTVKKLSTLIASELKNIK